MAIEALGTQVTEHRSDPYGLLRLQRIALGTLDVSLVEGEVVKMRLPETSGY